MDQRGRPGDLPEALEGHLRCDFCGRQTARVRRVALDRGYDRLAQKHAVRFACDPCSRSKELQRRGQVDVAAKPL